MLDTDGAGICARLDRLERLLWRFLDTTSAELAAATLPSVGSDTPTFGTDITIELSEATAKSIVLPDVVRDANSVAVESSDDDEEETEEDGSEESSSVAGVVEPDPILALLSEMNRNMLSNIARLSGCASAVDSSG